ncbi:type 1 glutamine amidotransferase domain-containing protein [Pseudomonas aegrilactucae]|uniref:Type 1 glutamine amidotransferase n=1 Tax=Pseudomonas aegrilactucae TaxID=2854028 RepID=A0A9Q3ADW9_9PSED|nr:type 1 glutamine amidotransferase domain-containing protein [Pseudomonas aegrilactucae]MBV6289112.1 type 1 glutamine amidotransferase [Pseudomonas aegrilactucae]
MTTPLSGKRVAMLVTDGFEQVELTGPMQALQQSGARVEILSDKAGTVKGWHHDEPADDFTVDGTFDAARGEVYDAIVLPGGVQNSDTIRINSAAQKLVKAHDAAGKTLAVICHGGWLLVSSNLVKDRKMTSYKSVRDDIINAGGLWLDDAVVIDGNLISSRDPDDIPAFNAQLLSALGA